MRLRFLTKEMIFGVIDEYKYQDLRGYLIILCYYLLVDLETGCDCIYKEIPLDQPPTSSTIY